MMTTTIPPVEFHARIAEDPEEQLGRKKADHRRR